MYITHQFTIKKGNINSSCRKGNEIQKLSVIETLPKLLAEDAHSCITRVLPKIQQSLPTASTEFHMAASVIFKQVLEQRLVSHSTFTEVFLQSILSSLESREPGNNPNEYQSEKSKFFFCYDATYTHVWRIHLWGGTYTPLSSLAAVTQ